MAIAHDTTTTATAYTSTGTQTTSHAAAADARAAVVLIEQNGTTTDEVSGVTYGGIAMTRLRSDTEATEAGRVYIYWLDSIPGGTQNVAMTTTAATNKQLSVSTMTVAAGAKVAVVGTGNTGTSASASNPALSLSGLTNGVTYACYEVIHSGLTTMTTTPQTTPAWTLISSTDLGAQGRGFARYTGTASGTSITGGWIASTADDYVISGVAFTEATLTYDFSASFDSGSSPWGFDLYNGTAGAITLDTTNQLYGAGCIDCTNNAGGGRVRMSAGTLPNTGPLYYRFYFYQVDTPTTATSFFFKRAATGGTANLLQLAVSTTNGLSIRDNTGTAQGGQYTISNGQWYRMEVFHNPSTSQMQLKVWATPSSTGTPDFDSGAQTTTGTPDLLTVGQDSNTVVSHHRIDEFAISNAGWIGPFNALTPVSASRATTWSVGAQVSATRATTWTALAAVTPATRASTWNVAAQVSSTRATTWTTRAVVQGTRATTWNVLGAVSASRATSWAVRSQVAATRATTWNVAAQVASTRATTWAVLAAVAATRATTWNVASALTPVSASRATTWHVRAVVTGTRATAWTARAMVSGSRATSWTVRTPVASTRATTWVARALVTGTRATSWKVSAQVAASRATLWSVLTPVAASLSTTWAVIYVVPRAPGETVLVLATASPAVPVLADTTDGVLVLADPRTVIVTDGPAPGVVVRQGAAGAAIVREPV